MNLNQPTKQQKEILIAAYESNRLTKDASRRIKVMLENGDLWHEVSELNELLTVSKANA